MSFWDKTCGRCGQPAHVHDIVHYDPVRRDGSHDHFSTFGPGPGCLWYLPDRYPRLTELIGFEARSVVGA